MGNRQSVINPLLFIPSARDLPQVKRRWHTLPYDKYIVKYHLQAPAYALGKKCFLSHPEYTHIVVMPDDLEIEPHLLEQLLDDAQEHSVVMGYCSLQEDQPHILNIQDNIDNGISPSKNHGSWLQTEDVAEKPLIFRMKFAGMACGVIRRDVFEQARWTSTQRPDGSLHGGNYDYAFAQDMWRLDIPIMVDKRCKFKHWRIAQRGKELRFKYDYPYDYLWKNSS